MSQPPNEFDIDYDKPGFCALCHVQIAEFEGFKPDMIPNIVAFRPTKREMRFLMDDGSGMTVNVCTACHEGMRPEQVQVLMESIQQGWHWEVENVLRGKKWDDAKCDAYLARYRQRHIVNRFEKPWGLEDMKKLKKPRKDKLSVKR